LPHGCVERKNAIQSIAVTRSSISSQASLS
jgi:hypothetical protein